MRTRRIPQRARVRSTLSTLLVLVLLLVAWFVVRELERGDGAVASGDGPVVDAGGDGRDYERDAFGSAWLDVDDNGCDTRNDVLARDLSAVRLADDGCTVLAGVLDDPYTGAEIDFRRGVHTSAAVQIDHIVPLSYAWRHGADEWTAERRESFANDPQNLLAVDGPSNSAKSDSGPAEWMPAAAGFACDYAARFDAVLERYGLSIAPADESVLERLETSCPIG